MQELLAIQQQGPRAIGFFGTRNMGFMHQELIEILSYAMVITVRCYNLNSVYLVWNFGYTLSTSDVSILYVLDLLHDSCYCWITCRKITFLHPEHLELTQLLSEVL